MAPRKNYTLEQMSKAIEAVRNGSKVAVAAKSYGVPRITLYNKITGKTQINCAMGPDTVLSKDQEEILVKWLLALSEKHFPISKECLQDSVQKIIIEQNIRNPFTNNRPGKKWCKSFLRRHPVLVEKMPENLSKARDNVSEKDILNWFQEINDYLQENSLQEVVKDPNRVFNADESAFFLSPKQGRVLAKKGDKHLYSVCGDEKDNLTVLFTGNAAGLLAPPMIVFSYERIPSHIAASVPENWAIGKSESGWMCGSTFYEYITNIFNPWLEENQIQKPVLFFLDGHKSHLTLHLSNFCAQNGIEIIALYPNSTHILQPMDLSVFRPLKLFWKKAVNEWKMENLGQNIKKEHFAPVLQKAVANLTENCIKNGFRAGGLCPFGPEYIDMTKLKHREKTESIKSNPELTAFVRYLENEIVKVFSVEKLNLFNELFYKNRSTVDNSLPNEDVALYVIWAKNKSECGLYIPPIDSVIVNNQSNSEPTSPTILKPLSNSSITENEDLSRGPLLTKDESITALTLESSHTDQSSNKPQEDIEFLSTIPAEILDLYATKDDSVLLDGLISDPINHLNINPVTPQTTLHSTGILSQNKEKNDETHAPENISERASASTVLKEITSVSQTKDHNDENLAPEIIPESVPTSTVLKDGYLNGNTAIPGPSNYRTDTITPQKKSMDAVLGITVPSPFKRNLFWPENDYTKKTKRIKKEKIPSAVTSKAWREYHEKKEIEKKKLEESKAKRARERQEKKILKEKNAEKRNKKCVSQSDIQKLTLEHPTRKDSNLEVVKENLVKEKSKRKKLSFDDSTSEDSDLEIKYAESDDSYLEEIDESASEEEKKRVELALGKITNQDLNTKRRQRQSKCQKTHSYKDTSDSDTSKSVKGPKKILHSGCYVIVMYEGEYFPGRVEDVNGKQYEVSTMSFSTGNSFRWPEKPDKIWYREDQVVEKIGEPLCINKRGFFRIKEMEKYLPHLLYT